MCLFDEQLSLALKFSLAHGVRGLLGESCSEEIAKYKQDAMYCLFERKKNYVGFM